MTSNPPGGGLPRRESLNVFGEPIQECSCDPMTGFFRDGSCHTDQRDLGFHTVCCILTKEFLDFSFSRGNDLITPRPQYQFPGLRPGQKWCLCAKRWLEAHQNQRAPRVNLKATHIKTLEIIPLEVLKSYE